VVNSLVLGDVVSRGGDVVAEALGVVTGAVETEETAVVVDTLGMHEQHRSESVS